MDNPVVQALAASIVRNKAYVDLKAACYESSASDLSHPAVVKLFKNLEEWSVQAKEAVQLEEAKKSKKQKPSPLHTTDPDLSEDYDPNEP